MTSEEIRELLTDSIEFLKIENLPKEKLYCSRIDLNGLILLDKLLPNYNTKSIIAASEHDIIYLEGDLEELIKTTSKEDIINLSRCGIFYDKEYDCLAMFT